MTDPETTKNVFDYIFGSLQNDKLPPGLTDSQRGDLEYQAMLVKRRCPTCWTMLGIDVVHGR